MHRTNNLQRPRIERLRRVLDGKLASFDNKRLSTAFVV
jgi:hypothetical protein